MILEQTAARQTKLLSLLRREFGLSAGLVKRLKWQNALFVNGAPAHTDAPVTPGDRVRVVLEERTEGFDPEPLPLSILYEDECFLAVDKSSGMLVHPSPQKNSGTLANGVLYHLLERGEASGVHPVTRLDRDTFGVVILAKNANIHDRFCRMLRERQLEKTYLAAVFGQPPQENGQIDLPVYKVGGGSLIRVVDERGQRALTQYRAGAGGKNGASGTAPPDGPHASAAAALHGLRLPHLRRPAVYKPGSDGVFRRPRTVHAAAVCRKARFPASHDRGADGNFVEAGSFLPKGLGKRHVVLIQYIKLKHWRRCMEKKNAVYTIMEEQSPEEARREHILLIARNFAAGAAAVLFLASFALADIHKLLRAAAYFLGAGAYFAEILVLTDGFRRKVPRKELFMAYCFGPLYILLGLSYLLEA